MSPPSSASFLPSRIVSGGQTGVDRSGLEVAMAFGIEQGGWCPKGRLSEDGSIPSRYVMTEMDSSKYPPRTRQNVIDSDATLILYERRLKGGTLLTRRYTVSEKRPYLCAKMEDMDPIEVRQWIELVRPGVLNIAGPRESTFPGIEKRAFEYLMRVFNADADADADARSSTDSDMG